MSRFDFEVFGAVLFGGALIAIMLSIPFGWLGPVSAAGPTLGLALHCGWLMGEEAGGHG